MYICLLAYSIVSALGVLAWWLSFDTSSPLAIGGIAGCIAPALIAIFHVECLLYKFCKRDPIEEDHGKVANFLSLMISTSAAIGVTLAGSIAAIFPNPKIGFTLISGMIGLIAPILGLFATVAIVHCVDETAIKSAVSAISITDSTYVKISQEEEVNKSIIFPKVEKVFSARETAV
ncbi:hypothetical protein OUY_04890 [Wolbachia endosymbiont of Leptopilina clavipes]|uniref:hypothetical protein n=1 Tax=Wolbachia endosymbiont of Leptopilina clavipes TaxID=260213 RepID=UPI001119DA7D|nr:hypothetical protein [Wolbachia endosymbiont of Leptopilina clavipes]TNK93685.1 hypothetical protein OUY_04890 [Wolbachia endosymbiont of Leptopilina clavipes]